MGSRIYDAPLQLVKCQLQHYTDCMNQICQPFKQVGIIDFIYLKFSQDDASFIDLSTNIAWTELFFKRFYQLEYLPYADLLTENLIKEKNMRFHLWSVDAENPFWQEAKTYFNLGNGIIIEIPAKDYKEQFYFIAHKDNAKINDFYLNDMVLLQKFIFYFKDKARKLIQSTEEKKFIFPKEYIEQANACNPSILESINKEFIFSITPERYHLFNAGQDIILSDREVTCMKYVVQGWNAQEIGKILKISPRTVEAHINHLKLKLDCYNLHDLIYLLTTQKII